MANEDLKHSHLFQKILNRTDPNLEVDLYALDWMEDSIILDYACIWMNQVPESLLRNLFEVADTKTRAKYEIFRIAASKTSSDLFGPTIPEDSETVRACRDFNQEEDLLYKILAPFLVEISTLESVGIALEENVKEITSQMLFQSLYSKTLMSSPYLYLKDFCFDRMVLMNEVQDLLLYSSENEEDLIAEYRSKNGEISKEWMESALSGLRRWWT